MARQLLSLCGCLWAVSLLACTEPPTSAGNGPACVEGDIESCTCDDGADGVRTCGPGPAFGACDCSGAAPVVPDLVCDPGTLDFGRVLKGQERVLEVTCRNRAAAADALVVAPIAGEDRAQFGHDRAADGGAVTVPAGGDLTVAVTYRAVRSGSANASLELLRVEKDGTRSRAARIRLAGFALDHAVGCSPTVLDFGYVAPATERHREIVCRNESERPFEITVVLDAASDNRFTWTPNDHPIVIPAAVVDVPGEVRIDVAFRPTVQDAGYRKNGILVLHTNDPTTPRVDVQMVGFAGGPVLGCSPARLDFGVVAVGLPVTRSFACASVGADDPTRTDDALVVTEVSSTGPEFAATVRGELNPAGYRVGESFVVDVTYRPVDDGIDTASIELVSNDSITTPEAPRAVEVQGLGRDLPPCDFELAPGELRFGVVEKDRAATLEFAVRNNHADAECLIRDLRLAPTCDAAFTLPTGPVDIDVLPPAGERRFPVQFLPTAHRTAPYTCDVLFDISNPVDPHQVVHMRGASTESCVLFAPPDLDFGTVKPGCATSDREIRIFNTCSQPLVPPDLVVGEGASDEFFVRAAPPNGFTIAPGLSTTFTVAYRPEDEGIDLGSLLAFFPGETEPHLVTLRGRAALDAIQTDTFEQNAGPVDVLWVVQNGHFAAGQANIAANAAAFLSFAQEQAIDFQIGVTTSGLNSPCGNPGGAGGAEDGRLFPVDNSRPRILKPTTPNLDAVWAANFMVGTCHYDERFMEAAYRALTPPVIDHCDDPRHPEPDDGNCGFLRKDAHLSIIAVGDDYDGSSQTGLFYSNAFRSLKGFTNGPGFSFHAITGDRGTGCTGNGSAVAGDRLIDLAESTEGGSFHSICTSDWPGLLRDVSKAAFGYRSCFALKGRPEDSNGNGTVSDLEGELQVRVDGMVSPSRGPQGQVRWTLDAAEQAVCFEAGFLPEPGSQVEISYRVACLSW